jgi:hypothetical protein
VKPIPPGLIEHLAIAEYLKAHYASARTDGLNPEANGSMAEGERLAAKFAGGVAAWVSMPHGSVTASVTDQEAFTAYVKKEIPSAVITVEIVRPETQKAYLTRAKAGEKIPGVTVGTSDPSVRVELTPQAGDLIGQAWRSGELTLSGPLSLPAAAGEDAGEAVQRAAD